MYVLSSRATKFRTDVSIYVVPGPKVERWENLYFVTPAPFMSRKSSALRGLKYGQESSDATGLLSQIKAQSKSQQLSNCDRWETKICKHLIVLRSKTGIRRRSVPRTPMKAARCHIGWISQNTVQIAITLWLMESTIQKRERMLKLSVPPILRSDLSENLKTFISVKMYRNILLSQHLPEFGKYWTDFRHLRNTNATILLT